MDWVEGTVVNRVYSCTSGLEFELHPLHQSMKVIFCVVASADACLISHHDDEVAFFFRRAGKRKDSFYKNNILFSMNIPVIYVDHSITIKK